MATSGARLHLAIAPAGSGKTTAMRALTRGWSESGGTVIGLAPSAAAAAVLGEQAGIRAETMAKLVDDLDRRSRRGLAAMIGPDTLVVIDEAGMADTLTLDRVVTHALDQGASVRLVGDDQQLAAIGAGGVLRDIASTHGVVRLDELVRFTDPAEAAATLALRDGRPEALGYYLDHDRVHVGDPTVLVEDVFDSWLADRDQGLDAAMLAPTRDLVADLNRRAREHRLSGAPTPPGSVGLADGNHASVGELVITRDNNRSLRVSGTDWVKNGDRWHVLDTHHDGSLTVAHTRSGLRARLPAAYVQASVELGYATTIHSAQGVSADTMHGLATGRESRQQLYTMLTRGRSSNHVYVQLTAAGSAHDLARPGPDQTLTATEILEQVLARDDAPRSATTTATDLANPAHLLAQAADRYVDALHVAAEQVSGPETPSRLEATAEAAHPGLTREPAWPTLRSHLLLIAATGHDPHTQLTDAEAQGDLNGAYDAAAVLDWRLDNTGLPDTGPGPLPWIPAIPDRLATHDTWGPYLAARAELVEQLATTVRDQAVRADTPAWAGDRRPDDRLLGDIAVWRAATIVPTEDHRPTGPAQYATAPARHQASLRTRLARGLPPALAEWGDRIRELAPTAGNDSFTGELAERLAALSRRGHDANSLLTRAARQAPLPDDHPAAALWWRLQPHLPRHTDTPTPSRWTEQLDPAVTRVLAASPSWLALNALVTKGVARGWHPTDLLTRPLPSDSDPVEEMVWRVATLTNPPAAEPGGSDTDLPPHDLTHGVTFDRLDPLAAHVAFEPDTRPPRPDTVAAPRADTKSPNKEQRTVGTIDVALRWATLGARLDPRLPDQPDWSRTARLLQRAHNAGIDIPGLLPSLAQEPLGTHPAGELCHRLRPHLARSSAPSEPDLRDRPVTDPRKHEISSYRPLHPQGPSR